MPPLPFGSGERGTLAGERGSGRVLIPTRGHTLWYSTYIYVLYCISLTIKPIPARPPPFCILGRSPQRQDRSRPLLPAGAVDESGAGQPALAHPLFAHSRAASRTGVSEVGYKMSSSNFLLFLHSFAKLAFESFQKITRKGSFKVWDLKWSKSKFLNNYEFILRIPRKKISRL